MEKSGRKVTVTQPAIIASTRSGGNPRRTIPDLATAAASRRVRPGLSDPPPLAGETREAILDLEDWRTVECGQTVRTTGESSPMSAVTKPYLTPQQYLARERQAETKSEYLSGEMFAMSGASREHNLIAGNVSRVLGELLRERKCEVYQSDMRVKVSPTGLYTYPDVTVVCGEPEFEDAEVDTLLNAKVLVEVLSPSTADYDRGRKFTHYRRLSSLQEYVLISQDRPLVEHYVRQGRDEWLLREQSSLQDTLILPAIQCRLPLSEIYLKVQFPPDEGVTPATEPANP